MGAMASQITSPTIVYLAIYSGADQRKDQSSAPLAFVWGIHWWPENSPHKWPVTRKMFPFVDVIMLAAKTSDVDLNVLLPTPSNGIRRAPYNVKMDMDLVMSWLALKVSQGGIGDYYWRMIYNIPMFNTRRKISRNIGGHLGRRHLVKKSTSEFPSPHKFCGQKCNIVTKTVFTNDRALSSAKVYADTAMCNFGHRIYRLELHQQDYG